MTFTTDKYWDCECEYNYIHSTEDDYCFICDTHRNEQPDSHVNEVLAAGLLLLEFPKED